MKNNDGIHNEKKMEDINMVILKTVNNSYELNLIKSLLEEYDIPYLIKDYGIGGYMRIISGDSLYRTDILIEESLEEKAMEILNQFTWND